jgi:hypothetical protein
MNEVQLSIIVGFKNMHREAPRTLHTLSSKYQLDVRADEYEVIAVDIASEPPMKREEIESYGENFHLLYAADSPSPAKGINAAARQSKGKAIAVCIDGARMLSPGIIGHTLRALRAFKNPVVATLAWHLGPDIQNKSMIHGYNQKEEDLLLASIDWAGNGYELFRIATLAGSSSQGFFCPISESNFVTVSRELWEEIGGLDERFQSPGGGLVNLDYYKQACREGAELVVILGEGTFHQFHGGVATNVPRDRHPWTTFENEYKLLRGYPFRPTSMRTFYIGGAPPQVAPFLSHSAARMSAHENKSE